MIKLVYKDTTKYNEDVKLVSCVADTTSYSTKPKECIGSAKIPNFMHLNGDGIDLYDTSTKFFESGDYTGIVSANQSSDDGTIDFHCNIEATIKNQGSPITFKFYGGSFKEVTIKYYYRDNEGFLDDLGQETVIVAENKDEFSYIPKVTGYNILDIIVTKIFEPNSNLVISNVILATDSIFEITKVKNCDLVEEINILSDDLPANELNLTAICEKPVNEDGILSVYSNGTFYGMFFIDEVQKTENFVYEITAFNIIKSMDDIILDDPLPDAILTDEYSKKSLQYLLKKYMNTNLNCSDFIKNNNLSVFGWLPKGSLRKSLCAVAWSLSHMVDTSRSEDVNLIPIPTKVKETYRTSDKVILGSATLERKPQTTQIILKDYSEAFPDVLYGPFENLTINLKQGIPLKYTYKEPPCLVTTYDDNEITLTDSNYNYFIATAKNSDLQAEMQYMAINPTPKDIIINNLRFKPKKENHITYEDFAVYSAIIGQNHRPLTKEIIEKVTNQMYSRGEVKAKLILGQKGETEKVGDFVSIETAYDGIVKGIITKMDISFGYSDVADVVIQEWEEDKVV